jgi:carbonic anhydrase
MSVAEEVLKANEAYVKSYSERYLPLAPAHKLAELARMDARLEVSKILGLEE